MSKNKTMNKMGTQPVPKVMLNMGIPMILSMVLQACYNIVDSIFVARIPDVPGVVHAGEYAVNALTLAFPIQMLIVALGIGTGVGVNAILSRTLGEKDTERAAKIAGNGISLGILIYLVVLVFGMIGITPYLQSQTADPTVLGMAETYLAICTYLSFGMIVYAIYEKLLQSTGKTVYSTVAQVAGAAANIILDPIMIFGYLGLPAMGIAGAAYATVIGQFLSLFLAMFFQYKKNTEIKSGWRYLRLQGRVVKDIYNIGLPAIIMQALMSFMTYGVNIVFGAVSMASVTAYGIFYKIQQFVFFAAFGLRDAITPIVSYNYGMGSKTRVYEGIKYGMIYTTIIMIAGTVVLECWATPLVTLFGLSNETARLCILAIHIISAGFIFAGINIALQGVFQALGCGLDSLIVSVLRLLLIVLPLAWLLSLMPNALDIMWVAFPATEFISCLVAGGLMLKVNKRVIVTMEEPRVNAVYVKESNE